MNDRMLQFFAYEHLPPHLQERSKPFSDLAQHIVATLPSNPERIMLIAYDDGHKMPIIAGAAILQNQIISEANEIKKVRDV